MLGPAFLLLPERESKPRGRGLTHVLDKGLSLAQAEALIEQAGELIDIVKIGWGLAYLDPVADRRIAAYRDAGILVSLGGTLLEVCAAQDRLDELQEWATALGVSVIEVSNGLCGLDRARKSELIQRFSQDFVVVAEVGSKDACIPVHADAWSSEMQADLAAGARWVVGEGRESGTVGIFSPDGTVRADLIGEITAVVPVDRIIFESPNKSQQVWFVERFGADVNLGNIPPEEVLPLESLRLGLRADTARVEQVHGVVGQGAS